MESYNSNSRSKRIDFSKIDVDEFNKLTEFIKEGRLTRGVLHCGQKRYHHHEHDTNTYFVVDRKVDPKKPSKVSIIYGPRKRRKKLFYGNPTHSSVLPEFQSHQDCLKHEGDRAIMNSRIDVQQVAWTHFLSMSPIIGHRFLNTTCSRNHTPEVELRKDLLCVITKLVEVGINNPNHLFQSISRRMKQTLSSLKAFKSLTKFIIWFAHTLTTCVVHNYDEEAPGIITHLVQVIESCFKGKPVKTCPGIILIAPPGTGKSHFMAAYPYGFIDTDMIVAEALDKRPQIIDNLVASGFSIVTNRWEWKTWKSEKVAIFPMDLKKSLNSKGIYDNEMFRKIVASKRKFFEARKATMLARDEIPNIKGDILEWLEAYKGIENHPDILFIRAKNFTEGFNKLQEMVLKECP